MDTGLPTWPLLCLLTLQARPVVAQDYNFIDCATGGPVNIYGSRDLAAAPDGSLYVVGSFTSGTFSIAGQSISTNAQDAVFLAKYSADLTLQWLMPVADNPNLISSTPTATIDVDQDGNLIVGIGFRDTLRILNEELTPADGLGIVLMKLNATGETLWWNEIEADRLGKQGVAIDPEGDILLTGETTTGMFTAKYDPSGALQWWTPSSGNAGSDLPWLVQSDDLGNVYTLGVLSAGGGVFGSLDVDFPAGCFNVGFLAKYDPSGDALWVRYVYSQTFAQYSLINTLICHGGNVFIGGEYSDSVLRFSHGDGNYGVQQAGSTRSFLANYDEAGSLEWVKVNSYQTSGNDGAMSLAVNDNSLHTLFSFSGNVNHGFGPIIAEGSYDVLLEHSDLQGEPLAWFGLGGAALEVGNHIIHHAGHIYIIGATNGSSLTSPADCSVEVGSNMFILRFNDDAVGIPEPDRSQSIRISPNPTDGQFTVQVPSYVDRITISDATGRIILQQNIRWAVAGVQMDLSDVAPGVYAVHINGAGPRSTTKIHVQ